MLSAKRLFKDYALLWSMLLGVIVSPWAYRLAFVLPYSLFVMLALSYTRIAPSDLKVTRTHIVLFIAQWVLGPLVYLLLRPYDELLAQGLALIILTPTATSASVITAMMGGSMSFVVAALIPGNILMALVSPLLISYLYPSATTGGYLATVLQMLAQVSGLLILPILVVWGLRWTLPKVHQCLQKRVNWTFYIWCLCLIIVTSNTIHFFVVHDELSLKYGLLLGGGSLAVCLAQFRLGRYVGKKLDGIAVNSGQTLGQKNTVLAIWIALTFMNPLVSILPSFYVIWQNVVNSIELANYKRQEVRKAVGEI